MMVMLVETLLHTHVAKHFSHLDIGLNIFFQPVDSLKLPMKWQLAYFDFVSSNVAAFHCPFTHLSADL